MVGLYQNHCNDITELVSITLVSITSVALDLRQAITLKSYKWNKENLIITFRSYVRITLGSCVRLTLDSYVINYENEIKKVRSNYVWKLRQDYVTKIALELSQKFTLD